MPSCISTKISSRLRSWTETSASQVLSHVGDEPLVEVGDADRGVCAGHFAPQRAGHGEAGRQVVAGRDAQAFDAVFQLVELAVEADLAVAQDGHALGDALQVAGDVRAEQDRVPLVFQQFEQRAQELPAGGRIEAGDRFVEHQQFGLVAEGQHDAHRLQLAGRKRADAVFQRHVPALGKASSTNGWFQFG